MDDGTPRWVKVFGAVALVVIATLVFVLLLGGRHGPSRHSGASITAALLA